MRAKITVCLAAWIMVMFCSATSLQSAEINGVRFADTLAVGQMELQLSGIAILKWALWFDVYAGALYLPKGYAGEAWAEDIPKRLELNYFREIAGADFGTSSDKLLRRNLSETEYQSLTGRLKRFYALFRDVRPGDRYSLTYRTDIGTELRYNDQLLGSIPGADFAVAYFGLWLGPQPISTSFRNHLLSGDLK